MDPFPVPYAIKDRIRVSKIIIRKVMVRVHVVFVWIIIVVMIFHAIYCNKPVISKHKNNIHKSIVMDPFPVPYEIKDRVRVSKIIIRKVMVRVHVVFVCIIIVVMIFHAIYCNKQEIIGKIENNMLCLDTTFYLQTQTACCKTNII
jgi:hypothetical protein